MAFLTEPEFRALEIASSATEVSTTVAGDVLRKAKDTLEEWCGAAAVAAVEDAEDTSELKTRRFRDAQQYIAKAKLLLWVASRYRSGGVQVSEKDLNDSSVNSYERYGDAKKRHDDLIAEARGFVAVYFEEETAEAAFEVNQPTTNVPVEYVW